MQENLKQLKKEKTINILLNVFFFGLLILTGFYRIQEQNAPIVLMDEFGYWVSGAFFAGKNWTSISSSLAFYSYGYGLVLAILIKLFSNTVFLYKSAIILNAVLLGLSFFLMKGIGKRLFKGKLSDIQIAALAFVTCLYPTFVSNVHIAWSETMLMFMFSLCAFLLAEYENKGNVFFLIGFAISVVYIYTVHQRSLGVLVAGALTLICLGIKDRKQIWKYALAFLVVVLLFFISNKIKKNVLINVFSRETNPNASYNDYSNVFQAALIRFNIRGLYGFIMSLFGKCYYLLISSLGAVLFFFVFLFKSIKEYKSIKSEENANKIDKAVVFFLALSFVLTLCVAAFYTQDSLRADGIVYGRYTECFLAPFLMIGFGYYLSEDKRQRNKVLGVLFIIIFILDIIINLYIFNRELEGFLDLCSMFFSRWYANHGIHFISYSFKYMALFIGVLFAFNIDKKRLGGILYLLAIFIVFLTMGYLSVTRVFKSNYRKDVCAEIQQYVKDEDTIYFCGTEDGQFLWHVADMQILNPNADFVKIEQDEVKNTEGYIIIEKEYNYENSLIEHGLVNLIHH